ncbi:MAG: hypothetical protein ABEJ36_04570 [Candidatus Nanosalina sp.]
MTRRNNQNESEWTVFQQDVLDVLRQYDGFFDYTERVGSLSDDSRPDFVARVDREDKKEVWVVDAKNKPEINDEDRQRMEKYLDMLESNPIDVGLEISELSGYEFRGIFVTSSEDLHLEDYEQVKFSALHQLLQKELVYTDTEKVVRDVAKMVERKQLSQNQARLLFRSLKPFENSRKKALNRLEELETKYVGLELRKAPFESRDLPVEAMLVHEPRDKIFLIDIPYSKDALEQVSGKVQEVKKTLSDVKKDVYFAALDTFDSDSKSEHVYGLDEIEDEIRETAGIVSPVEVAEMFTPKISTRKQWEDGFVDIKDTHNLGFRARVSTSDDIRHEVEVSLESNALESISERKLNSRKELGEVENGGFRLEFSVSEDLEVSYEGNSERWESFQDTVKTVYQAAVNPVLSKKVKATL